MTRDEIIRMAEDCGISHRYYEIPVSKRIGVVTVESSTNRLCQFAELIAQQEREACAKLVEADGLARGEYGYMLTKAATRIRARGDASDMSKERVDETAKDRHEPDDDIYDIWVEKNT